MRQVAALADRDLRKKAPAHAGAFSSTIKVKIIINYPVACMLVLLSFNEINTFRMIIQNQMLLSILLRVVDTT